MIKSLNILFIFFISQSINIAFSQTSGNAFLETPACITLNIDEPLVSNYKMSISMLDFSSEQELEDWCGHYSNNLITLSGDFDLGLAYVELHQEFLSETKSILWWNDYLDDLCTYYINN